MMTILRKRFTLSLAMVLACFLGRCGAPVPLRGLGDRDEILDDCATTSFSMEGTGQVRIEGVDILVVVDNSMSMAEEQVHLAESFHILLDSLLDPPDSDGDTIPDHMPVRDLHIGVISTDMGTGGYPIETCSDPVYGDNGELQHTPSPTVPGCAPAYPPYLSYQSMVPEPDWITQLETGFNCISTLGIDGCGWEQQLKAAPKALIDHRDGINAGFLRPDSLLLVLFLTDEEDCSVAPGNEEIFDSMHSSLGHMGLRCFHHPYMLEVVDDYITAFQSLRADPDKLLLAFFVGVPLGEQCEGSGDEISTCLEHPDMIEQVDPVSMTRLLPSCVSSVGEAYPPRRFVEIAQHFGNGAFVRSICKDNFGPDIDDLAQVMHERLHSSNIVAELPTETDPEDPCLCRTSCGIVESLSDLRSCSRRGLPCFEPGGPGTGCADPEVDPDGLQHTLCEIPQVGTRMSPCDPSSAPSCDDPTVTHSPDGEGWYHMARNWTSSAGTTYAEPQILFTAGMDPVNGSDLYVTCSTCIGPSTGVVGSGGYVGSRCDFSLCPESTLYPGGCDWDASSIYFGESPDCSGGVCMAFLPHGVYPDAYRYCTRRCGPGVTPRGCPHGFECFNPTLRSFFDAGCWCVSSDALSLHPGYPHLYGMEACL